ncbi:hypothetical protein NDS46_31100 (plasmid) [Paenibacillus thiaminolyticus]|uniref:hypothetical protein n=1 Tax=Paenibacillus thiaminolyticus TaxID=49283 RepID=UPI00232D6689|nr:hypothetical protein [Paenibacillus thiaminolyticus]WCF11406.1 hypothetical protein NDS46_31100 [Paenibacillus thiaminolyticus]
MKKILSVMKNKAGYISIETIIVAGLVIGLGAYALTEFYATAQVATEASMDKVNSALQVSVLK